MKILFIGAVEFSEHCLTKLIQNKAKVVGVVTKGHSADLFFVVESPILGWDFHHEEQIGRITSVNVLFTIVSIVRTYLVRRFGNWLLLKNIMK